MVSTDEIRDLIEKLTEYRNEIKWAERNPDRISKDVFDKKAWKARILEARKNRSRVEKKVLALAKKLCRD